MPTPDQLPRLLWLHSTLHEAPGQTITARILDDRYDTWGLERKTKSRDLAALCQWAGPGEAPVQYDRHSRSWKLLREFDVPNDIQPQLAFSDPTTQGLQLSLQMLQATQGNCAQAVDLLDRLVASLPSRIKHSAIFAPARLGMDDAAISTKWNRLHESIVNQHQVEFHYGTARKWMRVDPLFLWWAQGGWYLLARQSNRPERLFSIALARMEDLEVAMYKSRSGLAPSRYTIDQHFNPMQWLGQGDWLYRGGECLMAHVRFDANAVASFRDRQWQSDAQWKEHADGTATLVLPYPARKDGEWEMARRILSWGEYCTVEKPAALVKRVRSMVATIAGRYEE